MIERLPISGSCSPCKSLSDLPHVLLIVDQFPKMLGGGERMVLKIARHLPDYGFRASILTFFTHPECEGLERETCPIYVLPLKRTYDLQALRAAFELKRFLRDQHVRLAQTFFESSDLWAGAVVKWMSGAKLIWSRRDMGILRDRKHHIAYRLMANMPNAVFAVSTQVRQHCIAVDGINPARVETIYNGLDLGEWQVRALPDSTNGRPVVTTVGNIRRVKGHDVMIRAAAMIAPDFPEVTFNIAGAVLEPDYFKELESLVTELGLSGRFHFVGPIADLRQHLSEASIFVLPSRSEGFSNAIIEAMAAGRPVIATDVGGNSEAVLDGVNGTIVPPDDARSLAKAIAELLGNPARMKAMGDAGKAIVAKEFTTEAMMNQIAGVYRRLLAER